MLKKLEEDHLYIKDMKLTDFAFLVNPGQIEGESYMPTPIYVGDKLISLDTESELNLRALKKEKIDEDDVE